MQHTLLFPIIMFHGAVVHLRNHHGGGSYLGTCSHQPCGSGANYAATPLQCCGPSISTGLFLCTSPLQGSSRQGGEGPWVWLAYRAERCIFSSRIPPPCFLTVVRRVHSQAFEGGIGTPRFLASEWVVGSIIDCTMLARDAGA